MAVRMYLALTLAVLLMLLVGCRAEAVSPQPAAASPTAPGQTNGPTVRTTPGSPVAAAAETSWVEPTLTPSATPAPVLRSLTSGGCCVEPFWSPDGEQILFIDRPSADAPSGLWGVDLQGNAPKFVTDRLGIYSDDLQLRAFPEGGETIIERMDTGERWRVPSDGRAVSFSPDGSLVAWTFGPSGPPFDRARREIWISRSDGSEPQQVFAALRGSFEGWLPDGRLLVSGTAEQGGEGQALWALSFGPDPAEQSGLVELGRGGRLREAKISPGGHWVAYLSTFSADSSQDGIWLADTRTGERQRLDEFGGYNWRDDRHLLLVPMDLRQPAHWLLQIDATSNEVQALTDPLQTPFKIANGDWRVSPDGRKIAFVSALDGNIWLLELPD